MCLLSILSATTWQQHLALWSPLFEMAGTTKSSALGAAGWSLAAASGGHSSHCVVSKKAQRQQCVSAVPARLNDHTDCWMKLSLNQITLVQSLVLLIPTSWMNDGSHALQNECVCVSLGWMHTVSNINYVTWCTGAYQRVCLAYPFHRAEWVSEWVNRAERWSRKQLGKHTGSVDEWGGKQCSASETDREINMRRWRLNWHAQRFLSAIMTRSTVASYSVEQQVCIWLASL